MTSSSFEPRSRPARAGLLLPWLLAPAWVFLPLGGCGLAKAVLKPSRASVVPVAPTMTVAAAPSPGR